MGRRVLNITTIRETEKVFDIKGIEGGKEQIRREVHKWRFNGDIERQLERGYPP